MEHAPAPEPPVASLVDRVMTDVSQYIRDNGLQPGAALPSEAAFALRNGVSRAVAREGFRGLAALKLIDIGNGRRARVSQTDDSVIGLMIDHSVHTKQITIQQIFDVRRAIELRTVALAVLRRTDAEALEIVGLAAEMQRNVNHPERVMEADIAFHEAIARASRNPLFSILIGAFRMVTRDTWAIGWAVRTTHEARMETVAGHIAIAAAIQERKLHAGEKEMADHFDRAVKALLDAGVT